jgi:hypothetical protein
LVDFPFSIDRSMHTAALMITVVRATVGAVRRRGAALLRQQTTSFHPSHERPAVKSIDRMLDIHFAPDFDGFRRPSAFLNGIKESLRQRLVGGRVDLLQAIVRSCCFARAKDAGQSILAFAYARTIEHVRYTTTLRP